MDIKSNFSKMENTFTRRRSKLWDHFTHIDSSYAVCNRCQHKFSYKSSISNLKKHLAKKHRNVVFTMEENSGIPYSDSIETEEIILNGVSNEEVQDNEIELDRASPVDDSTEKNVKFSPSPPSPNYITFNTKKPRKMESDSMPLKNSDIEVQSDKVLYKILQMVQKKHDSEQIFGDYVAEKLRYFPKHKRQWIQHKIEKLMLDATESESYYNDGATEYINIQTT